MPGASEGLKLTKLPDDDPSGRPSGEAVLAKLPAGLEDRGATAEVHCAVDAAAVGRCELAFRAAVKEGGSR